MSDEAINVNDFLVAVVGKSATGKSASLKDIENPEGVAYANCESGKKLPFRSKFNEIVITDPYQVIQLFQEVEEMPHIHTVVVDSLTFLMEMFESQYVVGSANTMQAWGQYGQFLKNLMQQHVAASTKNVIFIAHTGDKYNELEMVTEVSIPVKGAAKNVGVEAYFSLVIAAKKMTLKQLEKYKNDMLVITEEDQMLGYKHVFQTRPTKETANERLRGPMGMFSIQETFIDNNMQHVINRLREYYA